MPDVKAPIMAEKRACSESMFTDCIPLFSEQLSSGVYLLLNEQNIQACCKSGMTLWSKVL